MKTKVQCTKCQWVNSVKLGLPHIVDFSLSTEVVREYSVEFTCAQCDQPLRVTATIQMFRYHKGEEVAMTGEEKEFDAAHVNKFLNDSGFPAVGRIKAVAKATGYSEASVSRFLSGKQRIPGDFLIRLNVLSKGRP